MNVFDGHVVEGEEGFHEAEADAYDAGHEMWVMATKTQIATFSRHSIPTDTWQEATDLLKEVLDRTE
jgi:hypothetical protein